MSIINPAVRSANEILLAGLTSADGTVRKEATDAVTDYLRLHNREDGFARKILPPQPITAANLDRTNFTPDPVVIIDMEPESAGAYTVPFATGPQTQNIEAPRYPVFIQRVMSKRYASDVTRLLTWNMDIRGIFKDLLLKDIQTAEDTRFMATVKKLCRNVNTVNADLGSCNWITAGPLDRTTLAHAKKGLPSMSSRLNPSLGLINNITICDIPALTRNEVGGDLAEKMFLDGEAPARVMGLDLLVTIKNELVADHDLYMFAEPKYTGNFLVLEDIILSTENINFNIEFFGYEQIGACIRNIAAVARVSFTDSAVDWRTGNAVGSVTNLPTPASSDSSGSDSSESSAASSESSESSASSE